MANGEKKLIKLFEQYGEIKLTDINIEKNNKDKLFYMFTCDTKKIFSNENILSAMGVIKFALILLSKTNECVLFSFRVGTQDGIENNILYVINEINKMSEYGKFTLSNGDIDWEYRFDVAHTDKEDIEKMLTSFFESLLRLVVIIHEIKFEKGEK